jgi:alkanesulfonate monooxygenase SsuD/methylene tetrahydromethanopterin reductase-like flavin-dependent oxidoreductase (luciferase family)
MEGYQPSWDSPNANLVRELGLDEFLAERFAIVGTPAECRDQATALEAAGVNRIVFAPGARDSDTLYARVAEALLS